MTKTRSEDRSRDSSQGQTTTSQSPEISLGKLRHPRVYSETSMGMYPEVCSQVRLLGGEIVLLAWELRFIKRITHDGTCQPSRAGLSVSTQSLFCSAKAVNLFPPK